MSVHELLRHASVDPASAAPSAGRSEPAAVDDLLRRTISRLCIAARGLDDRLDRGLVLLTTLVRRPVSPEELQPLVEELTAAIATLDERVPPRPQQGARLSEMLGRLVERMSLVPALQSRAVQLRQQLRAGVAEREPLKTVEHVAELVNEQRAVLQREKAAIEQVLGQVTARLDEMAAHLRHEAADRQQAQDNSRDLNTRLLGEVRELDTSVREATDLPALQAQVRTRLELIDEHLRDFREREESRLREQAQRTETMQSRIQSLERETQTLQQSVQREQRLALTDGLTGVPNRLAWQQRIEESLRRFQRFKRPLCVCAWDIDRFKSINDGYGHQAGDKVLQIVARILAKQVRDTDYVARYGGEEFAMILDGTTPEQALRLNDKLRQTIESIGFKYREALIPVTISCGITAVIEGDTVESAFGRADAALYEAKRAGRNRCLVG